MSDEKEGCLFWVIFFSACAVFLTVLKIFHLSGFIPYALAGGIAMLCALPFSKNKK